MIRTGSVAPDFRLPDQDGNTVELHKVLEQGPLILYFYPADFTPGCTKEACNLRDMQKDLQTSGLRVIGVSPQDSASHRRFADKHQLPFTLLADTEKVATKAYDVDGPLGFGVRRASFLIGRDGIIEDAIMADFLIDRHDAFFRRAAQRAAGDT